METRFAVLLDTISIQKYVFSSNRLKENIGASYLVENIYKSFMSQALERCLGKTPDLNLWAEDPEIILMKNPRSDFEVGYVGGGNALLFFLDETMSLKFIREWTKELLLKAPGLHTVVAIAEFPIDSLTDIMPFRGFMEELHNSLSENKNKYFLNTVLSKHGITADCPLSGYSAEVFSRDPGAKDRYISSVSHAKLCAAVSADKKLTENYKELLKDEFRFTSQLDDLGQMSGDSYLAVVHIDGNNMAERFQQLQKLSALRDLSFSVKEATENAFKNLLRYIIDEQMPHLTSPESLFLIKDEDGKKNLPIRPIVLGGDDITFVTDGRLGIHFAEKFIEFFEEQKVSDTQPLTACAGIAIVKTKYPFSRAYEMAEQLCSEAKKTSREKAESLGGKMASWLDCQIFYGGISGTLSKIRKDHYEIEAGKLNFSPYLLSGDQRLKQDEKHIENLKNGIRHLRNEWPRSKWKELRQAITQGKAAESFYLDMKARGLHLPPIKGQNYHLRGWENSATPYFDMVELLEFYPKHCMPDTACKRGGE
ncbi:MAG: hypothetical protein DDT32_00642 [Syntrophomonadaceae bacterium]|nr:hypothetical protein [Bacillota bacterium]